MIIFSSRGYEKHCAIIIFYKIKILDNLIEKAVFIVFIGRENELKNLNELYQQNKFQLFVLYGRRRIGKTTLIREFLKNKKAIFFTAQEANDYMNLLLISKKIYEFFNLPLSLPPFDHWNAVFDFISEKAKNERFVLAFDEFPYAAKEKPEIKSILQNCMTRN